MAKRYDIRQVTRYVLIGGETNGIDKFHDIAEFKRHDEAKAVMGELNAAEFDAECKARKDAETPDKDACIRIGGAAISLWGIDDTVNPTLAMDLLESRVNNAKRYLQRLEKEAQAKI